VTRRTSLLTNHGEVMAKGGKGTMLYEAGLESGGPPEAWNVEHPDRVCAVHRAYLGAGARVLLTNTFGGNSAQEFGPLEVTTYSAFGSPTATTTRFNNFRQILNYNPC